jgi:hypothetical protein
MPNVYHPNACNDVEECHGVHVRYPNGLTKHVIFSSLSSRAGFGAGSCPVQVLVRWYVNGTQNDVDLTNELALFLKGDVHLGIDFQVAAPGTANANLAAFQEHVRVTDIMRFHQRNAYYMSNNTQLQPSRHTNEPGVYLRVDEAVLKLQVNWYDGKISAYAFTVHGSTIRPNRRIRDILHALYFSSPIVERDSTPDSDLGIFVNRAEDGEEDGAAVQALDREADEEGTGVGKGWGDLEWFEDGELEALEEEALGELRPFIAQAKARQEAAQEAKQAAAKKAKKG